MIRTYNMIPGVYSVHSSEFQKLWEYKTAPAQKRGLNKIIKLENALWEYAE